MSEETHDRVRKRPRVTVKLLTAEDAAEVLALEHANRAYFAREGATEVMTTLFPARHEMLVEENRSGKSMLFLVRDSRSAIVGRVNLGPIEDGVAELGYRIAEHATGRGYAPLSVRRAIDNARERSLKCVHATAELRNIASRRVWSAMASFENRDRPRSSTADAVTQRATTGSTWADVRDSA